MGAVDDARAAVAEAADEYACSYASDGNDERAHLLARHAEAVEVFAAAVAAAERESMLHDRPDIAYSRGYRAGVAGAAEHVRHGDLVTVRAREPEDGASCTCCRTGEHQRGSRKGPGGTP